MKSMTAVEVFDKISIHFIMNDEKELQFSRNNSVNQKIHSEKFLINAVVKEFCGPKIYEFQDVQLGPILVLLILLLIFAMYGSKKHNLYYF
jgi:hypothetical protein